MAYVVLEKMPGPHIYGFLPEFAHNATAWLGLFLAIATSILSWVLLWRFRELCDRDRVKVQYDHDEDHKLMVLRENHEKSTGMKRNFANKFQ